MNKKEIRKIAQQKMSEGKSHQESFDEIHSEYAKVDREDIANIIQNIPSLEAITKLKRTHVLLLVLLGISILFKVVAGLPVLLENGSDWLDILYVCWIPIFTIPLIYAIAIHQIQFYSAIVPITIIGPLNHYKGLSQELPDALFLIDLCLAAGILGLSFYIITKMTTTYKIVKEKYTNQHGEGRLRNKIVFKK